MTSSEVTKDLMLGENTFCDNGAQTARPKPH